MKYALLYESAPDARAKAPIHIEAHRALWQAFHAAGHLLLIGPFTDGAGALGVFATREAAERFVAQDPFVAHGVVARWTIHEWNEVLAP